MKPLRSIHWIMWRMVRQIHKERLLLLVALQKLDRSRAEDFGRMKKLGLFIFDPLPLGKNLPIDLGLDFTAVCILFVNIARRVKLPIRVKILYGHQIVVIRPVRPVIAVTPIPPVKHPPHARLLLVRLTHPIGGIALRLQCLRYRCVIFRDITADPLQPEHRSS